MKKKSIFGFLFLILFYSCNVNKNIKKNKIEGINLDANFRTNNDLKTIYNSIDTTSTTFIIDKRKIEKSKIRLVLDTLNMQKYSINIDKKNRIIEMTKKKKQ
ncbi:hypothetical protein [Flavobacterium daejeonense]|uniref:hypothetical protein n=1 Tax=Flavobacterium daejeonense TaxID=350893 RepID=UPI00047A494F|nr:hypothetical protein [Flavobacterium daejeonense]